MRRSQRHGEQRLPRRREAHYLCAELGPHQAEPRLLPLRDKGVVAAERLGTHDHQPPVVHEAQPVERRRVQLHRRARLDGVNVERRHFGARLRLVRGRLAAAEQKEQQSAAGDGSDDRLVGGGDGLREAHEATKAGVSPPKRRMRRRSGERAAGSWWRHWRCP